MMCLLDEHDKVTAGIRPIYIVQVQIHEALFIADDPMEEW